MSIDRPRGITLQQLDLSALPFHPTFGPFAMAEQDGTLYVVCREGVGWRITDDEPLWVEGWGGQEASLTPAEVRQAATAGPIDLADLVRTFGSRLESNFWLWHRALSA